jgi:hypothetical protein
MPYIDQFDGLLRGQDAGQRIENIRTMAVFTDGLVICAVGISGIFGATDAALSQFGALGALLRAVIRPGQQAVRGRRQEGIRKRASRLGPGGTAAAFARTRRKALAIPFTEVVGMTLARTRRGRQLVVHTVAPGTGRAQAYPYLTDVPAERVREVLGPLIGDRLTVTAQP